MTRDITAAQKQKKNRFLRQVNKSFAKRGTQYFRHFKDTQAKALNALAGASASAESTNAWIATTTAIVSKESFQELLTAHLENSIEPYTKKFKSSKKRKERKAYLERLYANPKAVGLMNVFLAGAYCEPLRSKVEESLDKARAFNEESNGLNDETLEKLEEREQYLDEHGDAWQEVSDNILDWTVRTESVDSEDEFKDMMQYIEENQDKLQECECE